MLLESVAGLLDAGARVVVALPGPGALESELASRGAEVVHVPMPVLRKAALRPRGLVALVAEVLHSLGPSLRVLRRARPDTVYVSTLTIPTWVLLGRVARARTVCHVHEAEQHRVSLVTRGLVAPLLMAHRVVVNSRFSASVLTDAAPALEHRTVVVLNGVAGPDAATPPRPAPEGGLRVLVPGRLSPRKGTDVAVRAVDAAADRRTSLHVLGSVFPGYEWFEEELRHASADLAREGRMTFTHFTPDVWTHVASADVVVVPSAAPEPFGNTAVEALLAGRPVVVSDIGGLPEAVAGSPAALRVPPGDPAALAAALEEVTARWSELTSAAWTDRETVTRRFAPERYRREVALQCLPGGTRP